MSKIKGCVRMNPELFQQCCIFLMCNDDGEYLVISENEQAVKDYLVVSKGQEIQIKGKEINHLKGIMITESAKITLTRGFKED